MHKKKFVFKFFECALAALAVSLCACSSQPPAPPAPKPADNSVTLPEEPPEKPAESPDEVKYKWERSGIRIEFYSTAMLNVTHEQSHNLMICMYQLSDIEAFKGKLNAELKDLSEYLACNNADPPVVSTRRIFIKPRMHKVFLFDREKDVKGIALIAGYYEPSDPAKNALIRPIPLLYWQDGLVFKDDQYAAAPLVMRVFLGKDTMQDLRNREDFNLIPDAELEALEFGDRQILIEEWDDQTGEPIIQLPEEKPVYKSGIPYGNPITRPVETPPRK